MAKTPMMQQYDDAKEACGDAMLLFRMGDFYELFYDDAKLAAKVLGLTLTSRDKGENPIPMAGFPHHQLDGYLAKIISSGHRAAVCEQVEDPKLAKGLVKREVVRVVTPGTLTDEALLDPCENNFLAAVAFPRGKDAADRVGIAWAELSTGRFVAGEFERAQLADQLARLSPSEYLLSEEDEWEPPGPSEAAVVTRRPRWAFSHAEATNGLTKHFGTKSLDGFGFSETDKLSIRAAGAVLDYLQETQRTSLAHIDRLVSYQSGAILEIDEATRRSLELTRTIRDGGRSGSLLASMDQTTTAMGSRMLGEWLSSPLTDIPAIEQRQDVVAELSDQSALRRELRQHLQEIYDLERLLSRITTGRAGPRDLSFVGRTLGRLPAFKGLLENVQSGKLRELAADLDTCPELRVEIEAALIEDCPLAAKDGGFVRPGYNAELDQLRELASGGKQWIAEYQAAQAAETEISNLKVGFNKVFGYYLEVTNAHREKVPDHFIRKQTLKNAERFVTPELKEYEDKVISADEKSKSLEYELFARLRDAVQAAGRALQRVADILAHLDVFCSLAELGVKQNYCRPQVVEEPMLEILDGRHPVLDVLEPEGTFVPNDVHSHPKDSLILLITGPNMAGKSTYIRQVALLTIMAQMGSFVPAGKATIGVADRVFARVGASDELSKGQSTFMVEMTETARILNSATSQSLVILDEIGRGTSTYDGVSLAWAVVEHLHDHNQCRTFFATHYHELTELEESLSTVHNLNVAVQEWDEKVVFLHKIVAGSADKSYGIHVARLAGVPKSVNERAKQIMSHLESEHLDENGRARVSRNKKRHGDVQLTLFAPYDHPLIEKIRDIRVDELRPVDALQLIQHWQEELQGESTSTKPR